MEEKENTTDTTDTTEESETTTDAGAEAGINMTLADIQAIEAGQPPSPPSGSFVPKKLGVCKKCGWKFVNEQVKKNCIYCGGTVNLVK